MSQTSLKDELKSIIGNRRKFMLLRIIDVDVESARKICNIPKGTYNSWLRDSGFVEIYRRRDEFSAEYKQEAIQLLRRANQLQAVLLEEKILAKMKEEIESGEYTLIKTMLARDVYTKLMADLDYQPQNLALTWEQRVAQLHLYQPQQLQGGSFIETEVIEPNSNQSEQHQESLPEQVSS